MEELIDKEFPLENSPGACWYVSTDLEIIIHNLDEMFKVQDYVIITPGDLALMNSALAQCMDEEGGVHLED